MVLVEGGLALPEDEAAVPVAVSLGSPVPQLALRVSALTWCDLSQVRSLFCASVFSSENRRQSNLCGSSDH